MKSADNSNDADVGSAAVGNNCVGAAVRSRSRSRRRRCCRRSCEQQQPQNRGRRTNRKSRWGRRQKWICIMLAWISHFSFGLVRRHQRERERTRERSAKICERQKTNSGCMYCALSLSVLFCLTSKSDNIRREREGLRLWLVASKEANERHL